MSFRHETSTSPQIWLVVADRSAARIFLVSESDPISLQEIQTLIHSEGTNRPRDVTTDRSGRFIGWSGQRGAGYPEVDVRHVTATEFAATITDTLEQGRLDNAFGKLIIIAPPLLLGSLRNSFPDILKRMVVAEVHRELVHATPAELSEYVQQALANKSEE